MSSAQATQQNKAGKKKKGTALTLGEFYAQVDTGSAGGNAAAGAPKSWADEMNSLDTEKPVLDLNEIRSQLPTAPKAALAPDINLDLVPKNPPFTAHLSNVSYEADDSKIRAFFLDSKILNVRLPQDERGRFRGFGQVDFEDRESLINALAKNETKFFNRPIKVQLESVYKQQRERAHGGGFHGSSSGAAGESNSDDTDWRARPNPEPESSEPSRQYSQTFMNRQQRNPDFQGGQQQPQRRWQNRQGGEGEQQSDRRQGGYQQREGYQRNEGSYQRNEGSYQRNEGNYQRNEGSYQRNEGSYQRQGGYNRQSGGFSRPQQDHQFEQRPHHQQPAAENTETAPSAATTELKERPKIMLQPRTLPPKELEGDAMATASGIFGSAKPVNTAAKEREIEEKIAKEREALALAQQQQKENEEKEQEAPKPPAQPGHERSHKTSFNSDDGRKHHNKSQESEFTTVGVKRQSKNDHPQNRNYTNNNNNNQRLSQSSSFTSPPSGNRQYQNRSSGEAAGHQQPSQNAWSRSSKPSELFTSNNSHHQDTEQTTTTTTTTTTHQTAPFTKPTTNPNRTYTNSKYQNRPQSNRDNNNKDMNRRFNDKNTKIAGGRGGGRGGARNETTSRGPGGATSGGFSGTNSNNPNAFNPPVAEVKESGPGKIENKFAALTVDDDGDGDYYDDEEGNYEDDHQQQHEEDVAAN